MGPSSSDFLTIFELKSEERVFSGLDRNPIVGRDVEFGGFATGAHNALFFFNRYSLTFVQEY